MNSKQEHFPQLSHSLSLWLACIIVIGLLVRLLAAYLQPAFYDEGHTFSVCKGTPEQIISVLKSDSHPPTYNLLMSPLVHLTDSIFLLRLPCLLAGVFSLWLAFRIGRRLGGEELGLLLAAVLALDYNIWLLDAQLRSYGLLDCALLGLLLLTFNIYDSGYPCPRWKNKSWFLYWTLGLLASALHFTGVIVVGGLLLACFLVPKGSFLAQKRWQCSAVLGSSLLPSLGWITYIKSTGNNYLLHQHAHNADFSEFLRLPDFLLGWQCLPYYPVELWHYCQENHITGAWLHGYLTYVNNPLTMAGCVCAWILLVCGWYLLWKRCGSLIVLILAPVLALGAVLLYSNYRCIQVLQNRHMLPLASYMLLFMCWSVVSVPWQWLKNLLVVVLLGTNLVTIGLFPFHTKLWNQNWQGAVQAIEARGQQPDLILVYHGGAAFSFSHYLSGGQMLYNHQTGKTSLAPGYDGPPVLPLLKNMLGDKLRQELGGMRVYLLLNQYQYENGNDHIFDWVQENFEVIPFYHEDSYTYWAVVDVCELKPKARK